MGKVSELSCLVYLEKTQVRMQGCCVPTPGMHCYPKDLTRSTAHSMSPSPWPHPVSNTLPRLLIYSQWREDTLALAAPGEGWGPEE